MTDIQISALTNAILFGTPESQGEPLSVIMVCAVGHDIIKNRLPVQAMQQWLGTGSPYTEAAALIDRCRDTNDSLVMEDIRSAYLMAAYGTLPVTYPDTVLGLTPTVTVQSE